MILICHFDLHCLLMIILLIICLDCFNDHYFDYCFAFVSCNIVLFMQLTFYSYLLIFIHILIILIYCFCFHGLIRIFIHSDVLRFSFFHLIVLFNHFFYYYRSFCLICLHLLLAVIEILNCYLQ